MIVNQATERKVIVDVRYALLLVVFAISLSHTARAQSEKSTSDAATRQFTIAKALEARRQFAPAAEEWTKFLKNHASDPRADEAQYSLGICQFHEKKFSEAAAAFIQVITGYPKSKQQASAWLHLGLAQHNQAAGGQTQLYAHAADNLWKYLKKFPKEREAPKAAFFLGEALYASGKKSEAVQAYALLVEKHPNDPLASEALYALGTTQEELGRTATAGASYDAYLKRFPAGPQAAELTLRRGETLFAQKQFAAAEKWFAAAAARQGFADADLALLRQAAALYELKRYGEAARVYASISQRFPESKRLQSAQLAAGMCAYLAGDLDGAREQLTKPLASDGAIGAEAAHWLALAYLKQQKHDEAIKVLDAALPGAAQTPFAEQLALDHANALYALAGVRIAAHDYAGAVAALDTLLARHPGSELAPRAHYARGLAREELKQFAPALDDVQTFLRSNPALNDKCDALYVLGVCQAGLNRAEEAAKTFHSILAENPRYAGGDKVLYELAWTLKSLDRGEEALDAFSRLGEEFASSPLAAEALYEVGETRYRADRYSAAATAFHESMQKAGKTALGEKAAHKLGLSQFHQDAFDKARQTFTYQRATWPQGSLAADAAFMIAEALFQQGKYADALPHYQQIKLPAEKDLVAQALLRTAQSQGQLKQWQASLATLTQATRQFSDSTWLPEMLCEEAWVRQNLGQVDDALKLYEEVTAKSETEVAARARFMIGEIYIQKKDYAEAIKNFFKAAYGYSYPRWQARAHYEAGRCYEELGKTEQAIKSYQQVIDTFPDSDQAPLAKGRLRALTFKE